MAQAAAVSAHLHGRFRWRWLVKIHEKLHIRSRTEAAHKFRSTGTPPPTP
jgi:hypothetical protein